ncbi:hypothetical protein BgiBS90_004036 [Biomphalaria glabrata]|nr:hypothetical protein BgiBS90_004036 [Biomphalaria glabrata]
MPTLNPKVELVASVGMNALHVPSVGKLRSVEPQLTTLFHMNELSYIHRADGSKLAPYPPLLLRNFNGAEVRENGYYMDADLLNAKIKLLRTSESSGHRIPQGTESHQVFKEVHQHKVFSVPDKTKDDIAETVATTHKRLIRKNSSSQKVSGHEKLCTLDNIYAQKTSSTLPVKSSKMNKLNRKNAEVFHKERLDAFSALCKGISLHDKNIHSNYGKSFPLSHQSKSSKQPLSQVSSNNTVTSGDSESRQSAEVLSNYGQRRKSMSREVGKKTTKVFLSEKQSGVITDCGMCVPCAPPATPTPEQLKRTEYVPSLQDIKAQRLVRQRLHIIEENECKRERKKQETQNLGFQKTMVEMRQDLKKMQRREIYALNKVMTDLENYNFQQFMDNMNAPDF